MTAIITPDEIRNDYAVETDLSDAALEDLIAKEQRDIEKLSGGNATVTETYYPGSGVRTLILGQDADSITSVTEVGVALVQDTDYEFYEPQVLHRGLSSVDQYAMFNPMFTPSWFSPVIVTFVPKDAAGKLAEQRSLIVQLVKLYIAFSGHSSESSPEGSMSPLDYTEQRRKLLSNLEGSPEDWVFV